MKLVPPPKKVLAIFKTNYELVPLEVFGKNPYKTLISTLLSSRTKDETTLEASKRLFSKAKDIKILSALDTKELEKLIYPVSFYKTKAKHLKKLAEKIHTDFEGQIPTDRLNLMKLPGVGRKTANLVLNRAYGIPAIAVDTHVHKISNILGWVNTKTPEQTEKELNKVLPKKFWTDINRLFVSVGRQYNTRKKLDKFLKDNKLI
jgi:endonuclease III